MPIDSVLNAFDPCQIDYLIPLQHQLVMLLKLIHLRGGKATALQKKITKHWPSSDRRQESQPPPESRLESGLPAQASPDAPARASPPLPAKSRESTGIRSRSESAARRNSSAARSGAPAGKCTRCT